MNITNFLIGICMIAAALALHGGQERTDIAMLLLTVAGLPAAFFSIVAEVTKVTRSTDTKQD